MNTNTDIHHLRRAHYDREISERDPDYEKQEYLLIQKLEKYKSIQESMRNCERTMNRINTWEPIKLLKMPLTFSLAYTVISGVISFFIYLYAMMQGPIPPT